MTGWRVVITRSEEETAAEAARLVRSLPPSSVVLLFGDLGAGKTAFVRGMAAGLGLDPADVSSPTFTIIQEYRALDLRAGTPAPVDSQAGTPALLDSQAGTPAPTAPSGVARPAVPAARVLYHVDLYRLEGAEIDDLGLDELTAEGGIAAIEWAEKLARPVPGAIRVYIEEEGEDARRITISEM